MRLLLLLLLPALQLLLPFLPQRLLVVPDLPAAGASARRVHRLAVASRYL